MADIIGFDCELDEQTRRAFQNTLSEFQKRTGRDARTAIRIATIDLCKSLRKQTRKAPKLMPKSAFSFDVNPPKYITKDDGSQFRYMIRKGHPTAGTKTHKKDLVFPMPVSRVYKSRVTSRGFSESWREESDAQLIRRAREEWGKIHNWGLAKKSWGWFMWRLFNMPDGEADNPHNKITSRHCEGGITEKVEPLPDGSISLDAPTKVDINIINKVRYIRRAMNPGALASACQSAMLSLLTKMGRNLKSRKFDD